MPFCQRLGKATHVSNTAVDVALLLEAKESRAVGGVVESETLQHRTRSACEEFGEVVALSHESRFILTVVA